MHTISLNVFQLYVPPPFNLCTVGRRCPPVPRTKVHFQFYSVTTWLELVGGVVLGQSLGPGDVME